MLVVAIMLFTTACAQLQLPPHSSDPAVLHEVFYAESDLPTEWRVTDHSIEFRDVFGHIEAGGLVDDYCGEPLTDLISPEDVLSAVGRMYAWSDEENPAVGVILWPFDSFETARHAVDRFRNGMSCTSYEGYIGDDADNGMYLLTRMDGDFERYGPDEFKQRFLIRMVDIPFYDDIALVMDFVAVRDRNVVVFVVSGWAMYDSDVWYFLDEGFESFLTETTDAFTMNTLYSLRNGDK